MALSLPASGAELALSKRCSRRIAETDGDDGNMAGAGSSSEREQMSGGDSKGGNSQKVRTEAGIEDQKRTSGGVSVAIDRNLGAVVGEKEGAVASVPGNEGRYLPRFG